MFKTILLTTLFALSLISAGACRSANVLPESTRQMEAEVMDAFKGLVEASRSLDASRYLAYVDKEKFTGLGADGKVWHSIKNLEDIVVPGFPMIDRIVSLEFFNVKVTVINPSTAILVNEFKQTLLLKNRSIVKQAGGGTQVWSKSENGWKLVSISASSAP